MALKFKLKSKDEVPAEHAALYVERDGAWVLDAEGAVEKVKLDELRADNVTLGKQLDEFKTRYEGIDPASVRTLLAEKAKLEEAQQIKAGDVDKVVESRVKGIKADSEKQIATLSSALETVNAQLTSIQIDQGVLAAATKRGLRPTAITDITARARNVFKLVNGAPRAFEADGQAVRYGRDGVTPMTLDEWVDSQAAEAPHLFESNAGGGAAGNGSAAAGSRTVKNPFRKDSWNFTEQMRLQKTDPQTAARLRAAA
jgi:hypothetical protein